LQHTLAVRDRRDAGEMTVHGAAIARGRLFNQLADLLNHPVRSPAFQRFAAHLAVELPAVFGFLFDPTVNATNWRAEQALRPAVVNRKVSGGNRSSHGAATQQILASVIHTARLRRVDTRDVLVDLLRARQPIVSPALTLPQ
jgi:transposase